MKMIKTRMPHFTIILLALFSICITACGGGGGDDSSPDPAPRLSVLPGDYDFGIVTDDNPVEPLVVTIQNNGTASLSVSGIALSGPNEANFVLHLDGGANPCGSATRTISAGSSCTVTVDFQPTGIGEYVAYLTITSNDSNTPYDMTLQGSKEEITEVNVKINQIEACPRPAAATVYVSVTDQGGFPITGLVEEDFDITEDGVSLGQPDSVDNVGVATKTLSVILVMDYSGSITDEPDNVEKMEDAAIGFIDELGDDDEAEIIKYASTVEVTQAFTDDQALLIDAIESTPDLGRYTALYDAVFGAATDISGRAKDRRAIIIISDGREDGPDDDPISTHTIEEAIDNANATGVPVFTVGLGDADAVILQQIADETGGTFSDSTTSANLATIYRQLADLLFTDQYILTYDSLLLDNATGPLTVEATYGGISGSDTKDILVCP